MSYTACYSKWFIPRLLGRIPRALTLRLNQHSRMQKSQNQASKMGAKAGNQTWFAGKSSMYSQCIDDFRVKLFMNAGFAMAMLDCRRVTAEKTCKKYCLQGS